MTYGFIGQSQYVCERHDIRGVLRDSIAEAEADYAGHKSLPHSIRCTADTMRIHTIKP